MPTTTIAGYAQTLMDTQWKYFWGFASTSTWFNSAGNQVYIGPSQFLGYGGAAFAFIVSLIGALETAGQTLVSIEESFDVWLGGFADGQYEQILKDAEKSDAMQQFLVGFTWDVVVYSIATFWHSFFTMTVGFVTAFFIFYKMSYYTQQYGVDMKMVYGFKLMLFGVLIGTIDYMGGNSTKNNMEYVLKSMGFLEHSYDVTDQAEKVTLTTSVSGVVTEVTNIATDEVDPTLDYEKLMYMQDKWFNFFAIQRGV